jgi:UDP-2-acetamido-3-amino-2,3-dideoxy-glucuronate N-acetyltransferase
MLQTSSDLVGIEGARLINLKSNLDPRGSLIAIELTQDLPFEPQRCFIVSKVPTGTVRGHHAHIVCHQLLQCMSGEILVELSDGKNVATFHLNRPDLALHIPPKVWGTQKYLSSDSVLLVFASHAYDRADYISDYTEFCNLPRQK